MADSKKKPEKPRDGFVALVGEVKTWSRAYSRNKKDVGEEVKPQRIILEKNKANQKRIEKLKSQGFKEE